MTSPANGVLVTWVKFSTLSSDTRAVDLHVADASLGTFKQGIRYAPAAISHSRVPYIKQHYLGMLRMYLQPE